MDFDDLLVYTYMLFRDHPEICRKYAEQFRYVLVDEYQDTNFAPSSIVLQHPEHQRVCVVGMMHKVFIPSEGLILTIY